MGERTRLVLLHTMDPRGNKLGGIETHVRQVLARFPETATLLFVGVDETGDLVPGQIKTLDVDGRQISFMPVVHVDRAVINKAATRLAKSTTLRFALGLFRHFPAILKATRDLPASCEIERNEFAIVPKLLGLPTIVLVHNEGSSGDRMDSLLKRYWWVHLLSERLALTWASRVFAVNDAIAKRVRKLSPSWSRKTEVMSVSVDTERFVPKPFTLDDDAFHICFAGRLDAFKDPPLMFATIEAMSAKLAARTSGHFRRVVFDYVGASDPTAFAEFGAISDLTVRHGIKHAGDVARLMSAAHAGMITSFFEGMPCYLLEMFASGRPVAAVRLPQFDPLILPNVSGALVERLEAPAATADALADAMFQLALAIEQGAIDPSAIAALVRPYSVAAQMQRLFATHEALALSRLAPTYVRESVKSA